MARELDPCNVFVRPIPPLWNETYLFSLFQPDGQIVSTKIMRNLRTGESRLYGFVRFQIPESAQHAINRLNGTFVNGCTLTVKLAGKVNTQVSSEDTESTTLYVRPIPPTTTEDMLLQCFSSFGTVESCRINRDFQTNKPLETAFVKFSTHESARAARDALNDKVLPNGYQPIVIRFKESETCRSTRLITQREKDDNYSITHPSPAPVHPAPYFLPPQPIFHPSGAINQGPQPIIPLIQPAHLNMNGTTLMLVPVCLPQ